VDWRGQWLSPFLFVHLGINEMVMIKVGLKELGIMIGGGVITFVVVFTFLHVLEVLGI
jgi:hypothetical protein